MFGYGSVGQEISKRLAGFDVIINAVDLRIKSDKFVNKFYLMKDFNNVLQISDIVILTLPLTEETEGFMNKEKLMSMKDDSILVNIARGKIINEKDLLKVLSVTKKFKGIILDVFEEEPLKKDNALWNFDNVIITPHNSFVGEKNNQRLFELIYNNSKEIIRKRG